MSVAWDVTEADVAQVLLKHGITKTKDQLEDAHSLIDEALVDEAASYYKDHEQRIEAALCEIEDQLIEEGLIPTRHPSGALKSKKFPPID